MSKKYKFNPISKLKKIYSKKDCSSSLKTRNPLNDVKDELEEILELIKKSIDEDI